MSIIKVGEIFMAKFSGRDEPRIEVLLGGLPVTYSILRPKRELERDDKYKLNVGLNQEQFDEVEPAMMAALEKLNDAAGFKATKKQLKAALERAVSEATADNGSPYRFFASKKMAYPDKATGELVPASLPIYGAEGNPIEGGVLLGHGSIVRSSFICSLWKKDGQTCLSINPKAVHIVTKVDMPERAKLSHEGLDDTNAYDY